MSAITPQSHPSFDELFKPVDTVLLALFAYLDVSFFDTLMIGRQRRSEVIKRRFRPSTTWIRPPAVVRTEVSGHRKPEATTTAVAARSFRQA